MCGSAAAPATVMTPRDLLRTVAQFTDADWGMVERGLAVAKVLDTDTREVAIAGAVRIHGTRDKLVARSRANSARYRRPPTCSPSPSRNTASMCAIAAPAIAM